MALNAKTIDEIIGEIQLLRDCNYSEAVSFFDKSRRHSLAIRLCREAGERGRAASKCREILYNRPGHLHKAGIHMRDRTSRDGNTSKPEQGTYRVKTSTFVKIFHVLAKSQNLRLAADVYRYGDSRARDAAKMCIVPHRRFMRQVVQAHDFLNNCRREQGRQ